MSNYYAQLSASAAIYSLLTKISQTIFKKQEMKISQTTQKLLPAIRFIEENYNQDITLADIASSVALSPYYLCKLFHNTYSVSPIRYLRQVRINHAKEQLLNTASSVSQIAARCGFHDVRYFCMAFKNQEGISALDFKKSYFKSNRD